MNEQHVAADAMLNGVFLLGAALVFVLLFRRLGLGAVLGYLIGGMLIGPQALGLVGDPDLILSFAEIGIILLLFLVGLELSPSRLWRLRRDIFALGSAQVIVCGLALFALILAIMGFTWQAALVIGLPLGLSSTAQVLPLLQSKGRLKTEFGEKSFSILLFQDLSIVPLLTVVAALSRAPVEAGTPQGFELVLNALIGIVILILAGRFVLNPVLALVGRVSERELFVVAGLFAVCASAALMEYLGLSPALGAFIAGVMLAESPYRHELEADVEPFRSILLGLFFLAVGMMLDLSVVAANPLLIIGLAAMLVVVKAAIIYGLARLFGLANAPAFIMALLLSQGGEFGFVLFTEAESALLIDPAASSLFGAVITLSMATTPFLMLIAGRLAKKRTKNEAKLDDPEHSDVTSVIVVGHGRFGQTTSQIIQASGREVTLIDIKPDQIDLSGEFGRKVFYGDGTRVDLLRRAGAAEASAILFCIDDRGLDAEALVPIQETFPKTKLFVRAFDRRQSLALQPAQGVTIRREVLESSIGMARDALEALDCDPSKIDRVIDEFRRRDLERMRVQRESGDMHAGSHLSFGGEDSEEFDPRAQPGSL